MNGWRFLTNHAYVLLAVVRGPDLTVREIAEQVGITERAVSTIVRQLEIAGYITSRHVGRRKHYAVERSRPFRHPMAGEHHIDELLSLLEETDS